MHKGVQFPSTYCIYEATANGSLAKHWKDSYEGVKYPCKHCTYKVSKNTKSQCMNESSTNTNIAAMKQL